MHEGRSSSRFERAIHYQDLIQGARLCEATGVRRAILFYLSPLASRVRYERH